MNTERQVGVNEMSETELDQVNGGGALEIAVDGFDSFWDRVLGIHDSQGRGIIHHFIDSGAHYNQ
jgi:bacteriocin-like protein